MWEWFCDLADWRSGGFSIGPLMHSEIQAWSILMGIDISPAEVMMLRRLDRAFREVLTPKPEAETPKREAAMSSFADNLKLMAANRAKLKQKPKR